MNSRKIAAFLLLIACCSGCIRSKAYITSNPPGAQVNWNGQYRGRTPIEIPFIWDWKYTVDVKREGYQPESTVVFLRSRIWQKIPLDFFAEALPLRLEDRRNINFNLKPAPESEVPVPTSQPAL